MMNKNLPLRIFSIILFLCFVRVLPGQSSVLEDNAPRFNHRFSWEGSEYALRYEVVIEREADGAYQSLLREFTSSPFLEFSLPPGSYRLQIIIHDIRDIPAGETEWRNFMVIAPAPAPIAQTPEPEPEAEPAERIKKDLPFDMYAGAAWMPLIPIYEGEGVVFSSAPSFTGAAVRFGIISAKESNLNPGLEFAGSWYSAGANQAVTAALNFLAQKRHISETAAVNFRLGAGYTILPGRETQPSAEQLFHTNLGLSFQLLAFAPFFIEAGFDYTHYFTNYNSGCLRPWIGFGVMF